MLGVMHNWIEGVLQHHAHVQWGIGIQPSKRPDGEDDSDAGGSDESLAQRLDGFSLSTSLFTDTYNEMLDQEVEALFTESRLYQDTPSALRHTRTEASLLQLDPDSDVDMDDEEFQPDEDSDEDDNNNLVAPWTATCTFSAEQLSKIHDCLTHASIPSWLEWPPTNLGDKSHGKLKADQWFILFSVFLPLVLLEIWISQASDHAIALLDNFYDLVICTNIVCSYTVTETSADAYLDHYIRYRQSSTILFPNVRS